MWDPTQSALRICGWPITPFLILLRCVAGNYFGWVGRTKQKKLKILKKEHKVWNRDAFEDMIWDFSEYVDKEEFDMLETLEAENLI